VHQRASPDLASRPSRRNLPRQELVRIVVFGVFGEELLWMVEGVGAGLAVIEVGRGDPFGVSLPKAHLGSGKSCAETVPDDHWFNPSIAHHYISRSQAICGLRIAACGLCAGYVRAIQSAG
jgi:hypothetical protein